jgi:hypothetical protein
MRQKQDVIAVNRNSRIQLTVLHIPRHLLDELVRIQ